MADVRVCKKCKKALEAESRRLMKKIVACGCTAESRFACFKCRVCLQRIEVFADLTCEDE